MWTFSAADAQLRCDPLAGLVHFATLPAIWATLSLAGKSADCPVENLPSLEVGATAADVPALQWKLIDRYVRTTILSIAYETDDGQLRFHVDWRLAELTADGVSLDVIVSVQTETLGIEPKLFIASHLPRCAAGELARTATDVLALGDAQEKKPQRAGALTSKGPGRWQKLVAGDALSGRAASLPTFGGADWHYFELASPNDFQGRVSPVRPASLSPADDVSSVVWTSAGESLEKGVLRRFRFRAGWKRGLLNRESAVAAAELERCWSEFISEPLPLTT